MKTGQAKASQHNSHGQRDGERIPACPVDCVSPSCAVAEGKKMTQKEQEEARVAAEGWREEAKARAARGEIDAAWAATRIAMEIEGLGGVV